MHKKLSVVEKSKNAEIYQVYEREFHNSAYADVTRLYHLVCEWEKGYVLVVRNGFATWKSIPEDMNTDNMLEDEYLPEMFKEHDVFIQEHIKSQKQK